MCHSCQRRMPSTAVYCASRAAAGPYKSLHSPRAPQVFTFEPIPEPGERPLSLRAWRARKPAKRVMYPAMVKKRLPGPEARSPAEKLLWLLLAVLCCQIYAAEEPRRDPGQGAGFPAEAAELQRPVGVAEAAGEPLPESPRTGEVVGTFPAQSERRGGILFLVGVSQYIKNSNADL
ncbi:radiation-inducible immediate-early gene IEX-1 [Amia ocellicauda]|uniref:radiation-inducible immediate-early gene IEX-1 n=1 Tax=Amia ocellicauda TaxID=2972642 RepID=UPI003464CB5D